MKSIIKGSVLSPYLRPISGIDEYNAPEHISDTSLQRCQNIFIHDGYIKKMPGRRLYSDQEFTNFCNGMYEYIDASGTSHLIVVDGTNVYSVTTNSKTLIDTVNDEHIWFETANGNLYYTGETTMRKFDGTTVSDIGITAPTVAPVLGSTGTGLSGNYGFVYTYGIESDGIKQYESNPSPVSSISVSNKTITVTPGASSDPRVNTRYIYRSLNSGASYFYDGKISNNTAGQVYNTSNADTLLGSLVSYNNGKPDQYPLLCLCGGYMFWADGIFLYWSVLSNSSDSSIEYVRRDPVTGANLNVRRLNANGTIKALKAKYNKNTGYNDLFIFTERNIVVLQNGDPNAREYILSYSVGTYSPKSVTSYNDLILFFSNKNTICAITDFSIIDISTYSIQTTLEKTIDKEHVHLDVCFNHFLFVTMSLNSAYDYNNKVAICDLDTLQFVELSKGKAVWFFNDRTAHNFLQLSTGINIYYDDKEKRIYQIKETYRNDEVSTGGTYTSITSKFRTKNFGATELFIRKHPELIRVLGNFTTLKTFVYYNIAQKPDTTNVVTSNEYSYFGEAIFGTSKFSTLGALTEIECGIRSSGDFTFSFEFVSDEDDQYFSFKGFQFMYQANNERN